MHYLGIDFGLKRVGMATSEGLLASPYKVIEGKGVKDLAEKVIDEASGFDVVIVGMPEGKMSQNVRGFIKLLKGGGLEVEEADETLSSYQAQQILIAQGVGKKKRALNDTQAAAIILQHWLDQR